MNLFRGRCRSKSTGSQPERHNQSEHQHEDSDSDDGEFYIPGGRGLYVTRTRSGKPALGRKKSKNRLLQDYGFDILGQAFGVPSRIDFERKSRRRTSFHTPIPAPDAVRSSTTRETSSRYNSSFEGGTPTRGRKSRGHSDSVSALGCQHHYHYHCNCTAPHHDRCHHEGSNTRSSSPKPRKSNLSTSANSSKPVPSPSQPPAWNFQPPSTPSTAANRVPPPMNLPTGPQGHAAQYSPYGNLPAWTPPQIPAGMNAHFVPSPVTPVSPVYPGFRSASMPVFVQPQPSSAPYPEARPPTHAIPGTASIPPPPPPLTPSLHPRVSSNPFRYSPNEVKKIEEHYKKFQAHEAESNKENEGKGKEKENDDFSQHIQHCHFCAACGAMRSKAYHKAHPLERGQIPERSYCHKCKDSAAAKGDNRKVIEEPAGRSFRAHGHPQGASQDVPTTDANRSSPGNEKRHKKNSRSWVRKARRLSLMSNMFPSSTASGGLTQPSETVASEEGSEYTPSAPIPITKVGQDRIERSASSSKQAVSSAIADASAIAVDVPSHARGDSAEKHQGRVPAKIVPAKPSRSTDKPEKEKSGVAAQTHERSGPSSKTYDKIRILSGTKKPEKRSRIPRPTNSKISSEATSNGSRTNAQEPSKAARMYHGSQYNAPGPSNAARMYHESQYKAPAVADEEDENVEFPAEPSGIFETASSGVRWDGSHVEQTSSQAGRYKSSRGTKGEYKDRRKHDQRRKPSPMVPRTAESQEVPEFGQQEHTDYGRTRRHRDDTRAGRRGDREQRLRFADDVPLASPNHPDYAVGWDLPLTPSDPLYPNVDPTPFFTDDFWGLNQEHADPVEQEAQAFAEPYPASASKLFENSTNSGTGFSRIIPSFLTRSEISVESYGSNGGGPGNGSAGPSATYKLDEVSETGGETTEDEDYRSVKKLEYSSKEDRDRKTAARTRTRSRNRSTHGLHSQDPHGSRSNSRSRQAQSSSSLSKKPREKNTYSSTERDDFGSLLNLSSPAIGSSTVAHTGHSMDLPRDVTENDAPNEAGRRRRIRRPSRM